LKQKKQPLKPEKRTYIIMFRKFANRLQTALDTINNDVDDDKVATLQQMGFNPSQARSALETTHGNVERAAELLLSGNNDDNDNDHSNYDTQLAAVLQESLQTEENRMYGQAQTASLQQQRHRSAANNKAAQAALNRAVNHNNNKSSHVAVKKSSGERKNQYRPKTNSKKTTGRARSPIAEHHPNVKVPPKLEDKSKEEQILRNVDRVKGHPSAVDTLYKALSALRNDTMNSKFRKIDKATAGYQRSLANVPGAEALLLNMNFTPRHNNTLIMDKHRVDPGLLYLGISALENAKRSNEYKEAKRLIQFQEEIKNIKLSANSSEQEAVLRAGFMSKCPSEPTGGRGALMQVTLGDEIVRRRFDGDDTLQDLLHWLGGHGSIIPQKLSNREWCLVDKNRYPLQPLDCEVNARKTLQYVGFWPSCLLEIRPSPTSWLEGGSSDDDDEMLPMGSSRGLGAAPKDTLRS